jgi:hypothetical protein
MKNRFFPTLTVYVPILLGFLLVCRSSDVSGGGPPTGLFQGMDGRYRWIQANFGPRYNSSFRNENPEELKELLIRADSEGGFPEWMKEYGRNLLQSCGENAILFTGGITDTAGAWFCQYVLNIRKDVAVLPMGMLDRVWFVDAVNNQKHFFEKKICGFHDPPGLENLDRPDSYAESNLKAFRRIFGTRGTGRPVYLSMDVNRGFLEAVMPRLSLSGCAFRLYPDPVNSMERTIDFDATSRLFSSPAGFEAIKSQSRPSDSGVDSVRNHYRFAVGWLSDAVPPVGSVLKGKPRMEWTEASFSGDMLRAPEESESARRLTGPRLMKGN